MRNTPVYSEVNTPLTIDASGISGSVSDPEKAARKILEIANAAEAVRDGRIPIEKINAPFLFRERARRLNTKPATTKEPLPLPDCWL